MFALLQLLDEKIDAMLQSLVITVRLPANLQRLQEVTVPGQEVASHTFFSPID